MSSSPTMCRNPTASNCQLRKRGEGQIKERTTLSTEECCYRAVALHRRREAIRKEEVKREKQRGRMRLREAKRAREQEEQPKGPAFIPFTLPHPLPAFGPACPRAALAAVSRILNAELTTREARRSHPREMTVSVMI